MHITWHGQACFSISAARSKGEGVSICLDPFSEEIGLKMPSLSCDIVLVTHEHRDHNNVKAIKGSPFVIAGPGEYEVKDVFVQGISSLHDTKEGKERGLNTIYTLEVEGLKLCHMGDFGQKELQPEQLDKIGDIDVLMIPVGSVYTVDGNMAASIVSQIEPRIVIPMHYKIPKLNIKIEGSDAFLKAMGAKSAETLPKLVIKKKDLVDEETKVIVLKP